MPMSPSEYLLTFFGDDFTGSTDVMETLALNGIPTALFLQAPSPTVLQEFSLKNKIGGSTLQAFGVAGITRSMAPAQIQDELNHTLKKLANFNSKFFHYKVCSTFDSAPDVGNIGVAIEIAIKYFPTDKIPLIVGAPFLNRFVVFGNLFARLGERTFRLDRHPVMSVHPTTPMHESDIGQHLSAQTDLPFENIDLFQFQNQQKLRQAYANCQTDHIIIYDSLTNSQLVQIGQVLKKSHSGSTQLVVGSSGASYAIARNYSRHEVTDPHLSSTNQILVVSGSCSPVTAKQIQAFAQSGAKGLRIPMMPLLRETERTIARLCTEAGKLLKDGKSVMFYSALGPTDSSIQEVERELPAYKRASIGAYMGRLTRMLLEEHPGLRTVIVGGDTCGQVSRVLELFALETACPIAPGAPLCIAHSKLRQFDGLEIALKGGQNGTEDYFMRILKGPK